MPTVGSPLPKTGRCDCAHGASSHYNGVGPCEDEPHYLVSECPCYEFHETQVYAWTGPDAELAKILEWIDGVPAFFIFAGAEGVRNVIFDALFDLPERRRRPGLRVWCRTGEVPEDLAELASRAREDDHVAAVYLDALLERGLARATKT